MKVSDIVRIEVLWGNSGDFAEKPRIIGCTFASEKNHS